MLKNVGTYVILLYKIKEMVFTKNPVIFATFLHIWVISISKIDGTTFYKEYIVNFLFSPNIPDKSKYYIKV